MTNARFASLHGLFVAPSPSRRRPFRFSNRALVTSGIISAPQERRASVSRLASSLRLRGFTHFVPPAFPFTSRRQTSDRSIFATKSDSANERAACERWQIFDDVRKRGQAKSRAPAGWLQMPFIFEHGMAVIFTALFLRIAGGALVVVRHFCGASCGCSRRGGDFSHRIPL